MNKKIMILVAFLFSGCAGVGSSVYEVRNQVDSYWSNPRDKVLVTVSRYGDFYGYAGLNCTVSAGEFGQFNESFKTEAPFARVFDVSESVAKFREIYRESNKQEKEAVLFETDSLDSVFNIVCQSEGAGIEGVAYFDGKQIAKSTADQHMGMISLSVNPDISEKIKE